VVVLQYCCGYTGAAIASMLEISAGAVKQHASRGRAGLRSALGEQDEKEGWRHERR